MPDWQECTKELKDIITGDPVLHDAWRTEGMAGVVRVLALQRDEARDIAGKAWDFILEAALQAVKSVGKLDRPEGELCIKWKALRYAVETRDSAWLTEAKNE
jgi:hypothetical protein